MVRFTFPGINSVLKYLSYYANIIESLQENCGKELFMKGRLSTLSSWNDYSINLSKEMDRSTENPSSPEKLKESTSPFPSFPNNAKIAILPPSLAGIQSIPDLIIDQQLSKSIRNLLIDLYPSFDDDDPLVPSLLWKVLEIFMKF